MSVDEIALTLPGDDAFHGVAHLVLSGLGSRHDLTVDTLDDLNLAVDAVLERYGESVEELTVRARIGDEGVVIEIGPFPDSRLQSELEQEAGDALDMRRILRTVCDHIAVVERDGGAWVELTKRIVRDERA